MRCHASSPKERVFFFFFFSEFSSTRPDHRGAHSARPKHCLSLERRILPNHSFPEQEGGWSGNMTRSSFSGRTTTEDRGCGRTWMKIAANCAACPSRPCFAGTHRNHNHRFETMSHRTKNKKSRTAGNFRKGGGVPRQPNPIHLHPMGSPQGFV